MYLALIISDIYAFILAQLLMLLKNVELVVPASACDIHFQAKISFYLMNIGFNNALALLPVQRSACWHVCRRQDTVLPLPRLVFHPLDRSEAAKPQRVTHCTASDPWCHRLDNLQDNSRRNNAKLARAEGRKV